MRCLPSHPRLPGFTLPTQTPYNFLRYVSLISPHGPDGRPVTPPPHHHGAENIVRNTERNSRGARASGQEII